MMQNKKPSSEKSEDGGIALTDVVPLLFGRYYHICPFVPCNGGFRDRIRIC